MSYGMGEGRKVRVPPLPAPGKEGLAFECMACGKWVRINTNSAWKKHVYGDLRPWICLKEDCAVAIEAFRTREDWISHLALDHRMAPEWNLIECPLCRAEAGPGRFSITKHLSHHLEEISLAALPADCEFDEESEVSEPDSVNDNTEAQVRNAWLDGLMLFQAKTGRQIRSIPALTKRSLSLFEVRVAVQSQGGHEKVSEPNDWAHVCAELGLDDDEITHTAELLQSTYQYLVEPYESSKSVQEKDDEPSETEDQRQVTTSTGTTLKDPIQRAAGSQGSSSSVPNITDDSALSEIRDTEERDFLNTEALSTPVRGILPRSSARSALSSSPDLAFFGSISGNIPISLSERIRRTAILQSNVIKDGWIVAEMYDFPGLLRSFGSDWHGIARHMRTKTAAMVNTFYNNFASRGKPDWDPIVSEAKRKVQRGEKLPVPPTPSVVRTYTEPLNFGQRNSAEPPQGQDIKRKH
ncbi:hypothetical protein J7T55_015216 [Diaporthe amygdali]|uniref:uncharacterized protein n=1 Tax=Phomopsis amygdali TaxID=1214568 RepID=UPI0022FE1B33|nr:uncharacterized protein J7T55_015216 [Diaporthe amygdali]KAJ0120487.1 hypothetical protein J7T55_015216 [Diaporthe amygdali]